MAAATTSTILLTQFKVDAIVLTGVAGGLAEKATVGDVVVADQLVQHDMDASPLFARYEVPLYGLSHFPTHPRLSDMLKRAASSSSVTLSFQLLEEHGVKHESLCVHQGLILSGDQFISSSPDSLALQQAFPNALAVEMEGAAVAQACKDFKMPFAVLRIISDRANDSAHIDFNRFIVEVASHYTVAVITTFLQLLVESAGLETVIHQRDDLP